MIAATSRSSHVGSGRPRSIGLATLRLLMAAGILVALLLQVSPARADPDDPLAAPTAGAAASGSTSGSTTSATTTSATANAPTGTGSSSTAPGGATTPVRLDLLSVSPMTPDASNLMQPVTITAVAVNTSGTTYTGLRASLERGAPIVQPALLNDAIASPPATNQWPPQPRPQPQPAPLLPGGRVIVTFVTTPEQMCMCYTGVFPYDLVVEGNSGSGYAEVGRAVAFIPSFLAQPTHRTTVSWVWPLIDQPHRIGTSSVFLDDDLARSVSTNGRLDRALRVVEEVAGSVRLTLVVDPRLIDELITMTAGYTVRGPTGDAPGSDAGAAAAWLARFRAVAPSADIVLTPYGDPDPDTALAVGGPLSSTLPEAADSRVRQALGTDFRTDIAWPDSATLTSGALAAMADGGTSSVLISAGLLADKPALPVTAIAPVSADGSRVEAIALDPQVQDRVAAAVTVEALREPGAPAAATSAQTQTSAARIQALLAQLALWPVNGEDGFLALAPPRWVDADPGAASAAILATASQPWSRAEALAPALADQPRLARGSLEPAPQSTPSAALIAAITAARASHAAARSLLGEAAAESLLSSATDEMVEAMASAWRSDPGRGVHVANLAEAQATAVTNGVVIVTPDNASYSLPSENSPLILTLRNELPYDVQVHLAVDPAPGSSAGFRADDVGVLALPAGGTRTLHVPAHFERSGRFQIEAQLSTVDGMPLSDPVRLNVLCTAIGGVALAVTGVAFGLLVSLLIFRAVRGMRRRRTATLSGVPTQTNAPQRAPDGSPHRSADGEMIPAPGAPRRVDDGPATS